MPPGTPDRAYEGFLELPVPVVLAVLWVAGAVLEGSCVAALYAVGLWRGWWGWSSRRPWGPLALLFTGVRGRGVLRTSPLGGSRKYR